MQAGPDATLGLLPYAMPVLEERLHIERVRSQHIVAPVAAEQLLPACPCRLLHHVFEVQCSHISASVARK